MSSSDEPRKNSTRRAVTDEEFDQWLEAADPLDWDPEPDGERGRRAVLTELKRVNWFRYRRLCRDFKWMQRRMVRMGLNPEDARFYVGYFK